MKPKENKIKQKETKERRGLSVARGERSSPKKIEKMLSLIINKYLT